MDMNLQQLKGTLQMLALPITAQVHLDQNEVGRVERLGKNFRDRYRFIQYQMTDQLTAEQKVVLARLDCLLAGMNLSSNRLVWSEDTLRRNAAWREVRKIAREALLHFNWPLDLPTDTLWQIQSVDEINWLEKRPFMDCCYTT